LARLYGELNADEIVVMDRTSSFRNTLLGTGRLELLSKHVYTPITYGGCLTSTERIDQAFQSGVDRIMLRYDSKNFTKLSNWASQKYGNQAVVSCINYREIGDLDRENKRYISESDVEKVIQKIGDLCVGEHLLQNVTRSGTQYGLDLNHSRKWIEATRLPLVISGGTKSLSDFIAATTLGFAGVAVSTKFSLDHTSKTPLTSYIDLEERKSIDLAYLSNQ
jgi:cyclase